MRRDGLERGLSDRCAVVETDADAARQRLLAGESFDAVVCDASMPKISGHRLLATVRQLADPPAFVLMSGHEIVDPNADSIMHEPFPIDYLLDLLEGLSRKRACATRRATSAERLR